jgi:hypothetical protein
MPRLTPIQIEDRADFVLARLKRGFSFQETQKQFGKHYACSRVTAWKWVNWTCQQLASYEDKETRRRSYTVIVEMFHDQIVNYQNDIVMMQKEIDSVGGLLERRQIIINELKVSSGSRHRELLEELRSLPEMSMTMKAGLIEAKSRMRERMYKVMSDLARLRGFNGVTSDWRTAINTLLDNNLLPPSIADSILSIIDKFEGYIRALEVDTVDAQALEPPAALDDLEFSKVDLPV